ncbi:MAG: hypothetical protein AAB545_00690 [Patescibacteria group bacterium]
MAAEGRNRISLNETVTLGTEWKTYLVPAGQRIDVRTIDPEACIEAKTENHPEETICLDTRVEWGHQLNWSFRARQEDGAQEVQVVISEI